MIVLLTIPSFSLFAARAFAAPQTTVYSIEDTPVWRVQLEVTTNIAGAGSHLEISLNPDNKTRLYPAYSNLGTTYRYDLILDHVQSLRDIAWIRIFKPTNNSSTLKELTLYVNGRAVYNVEYDGAGLSLGPNSYHFVMSPQLRLHALWRSYATPAPPQLISGTEILHRVESIVGDFIRGDALRSGWLPAPLFWRTADIGHAIRVTGNGPRMVKVELALKYYQAVEYRVDVEFDLEFSCAGGRLFVWARNIDTSGYPVIDSMTYNNRAVFGLYLQTALPTKILAPLQTFAYTNEAGQFACPPVRVVGNSIYLF
jgi:hypothetical protein